MKKYYLLSFLFLNLYWSALHSQEINRMHPETTTGKLNAIAIDTSGRGYAVSTCGFLMHTDDFGANWAESPIDFDAGQIELFPGTQGQVFIAYSTRNIHVSENGGTSFRRIKPDGLGLFNNLEILPSGRVVVASRGGSIFYTDDRGDTWQEVTENLENGLFLLEFLNDQFGWTANVAGDIWRTQDGGESWERVYEDDDSEQYRTMQFVSESIGFRSSNRNDLFRTEDGGQTWNLHSEDGSFFSKFFIINDSMFFCYSGSILSMSHDGGIKWERLSDPNFVPSDIDIVGENTLYLAGLNKGIFVTSDWGENWVDQTNSIQELLVDIDFKSEFIGAAGGVDGRLYVTLDGGLNWEIYDTPAESIRSVVFAASGDLIMLGDRAQIWKSGDLENFVSLDQPSIYSNFLFTSADRSMFFLMSNHAVWLSMDEGSSWQEIFRDEESTLSSVAANSDGITFLSFRSGKVLRSEDNGANWSMVKEENNRRIIDMAFIGNQTGFIFGNQRIWKTEDGGNTFTEVANKPRNFRQAVMVNDSFGVALGSSSPGSNQGYIYETKNGWQDYDQIYSSCQGLYAMTWNEDNGHFWFCGNGSNIEVYGDISVNQFESTLRNDELLLYPNPGTDLLQIACSKPTEKLEEVLVYSASGMLIWRSGIQNENGQTAILTSDWQPGSYFVLARTTDQIFRKTWIKTR